MNTPTAVRPIPEGYHTATPYLVCTNALQALEFYKQAFGATELLRLTTPEGKLAHAEFSIGDSRLMLAETCPASNAQSPQRLGDSPVILMLYVEDVDASVARAVAAGAKLTQPVQNQFYGDRSGSITDPFGHRWAIATHVEDVSPEETRRRAKDLFGMS